MVHVAGEDDRLVSHLGRRQLRRHNPGRVQEGPGGYGDAGLPQLPGHRTLRVVRRGQLRLH